MMASSNRNIFCVTGPLCGNSPVTSHKGQWRGALMFPLIRAWIHDWVNNREACDLRRHCGHYDVIVMLFQLLMTFRRCETGSLHHLIGLTLSSRLGKKNPKIPVTFQRGLSILSTNLAVLSITTLRFIRCWNGGRVLVKTDAEFQSLLSSATSYILIKMNIDFRHLEMSYFKSKFHCPFLNNFMMFILGGSKFYG